MTFEVWAAITASRAVTALLVCQATSGAAPNSGISLHASWTPENQTVVYATFGDGMQSGDVPPNGRGPGAAARCVVNTARVSSGQHHFGLVIDGAAKLALMTVDGVLCDGGDNPQAAQGFWFGLNSTIGTLAGSAKSAACQTDGRTHVRGYRRALRVSELVGSYKAGPRPVFLGGPGAGRPTGA